MPRPFFAFGPAENYFSMTRKGRMSYQVSDSILSTIKEQVRPVSGSPSCLAFGEDGSYFLAFVDKSGENGMLQGGLDSYDDLLDWLQKADATDNFSVRNMWVAIGPVGSYWAWANTAGFEVNVGPELTKITAKYGPIAQIPRAALGKDGSYIYWDEVGNWAFHGCETLAVWLNNNINVGEGVQIVTAALSIFHDDVYFVILTNGRAKWRVPEPVNEPTETFVQRCKQDPEICIRYVEGKD